MDISHKQQMLTDVSVRNNTIIILIYCMIRDIQLGQDMGVVNLTGGMMEVVLVMVSTSKKKKKEIQIFYSLYQ